MDSSIPESSECHSGIPLLSVCKSLPEQLSQLCQKHANSISSISHPDNNKSSLRSYFIYFEFEGRIGFAALNAENVEQADAKLLAIKNTGIIDPGHKGGAAGELHVGSISIDCPTSKMSRTAGT